MSDSSPEKDGVRHAAAEVRCFLQDFGKILVCLQRRSFNPVFELSQRRTSCWLFLCVALALTPSPPNPAPDIDGGSLPLHP